MKLIPLLLLLSTSLFALDIDKVVDKIAMIESGNNHKAVGDRGLARGAWQMHEAAWIDADAKLRCGYEWEVYAHDSHIGRMYATMYATIVVWGLEAKLKREPRPEEVYAAWRLGVSGFFKHGGYAGLPKRIKESCERFSNLYNE